MDLGVQQGARALRCSTNNQRPQPTITSDEPTVASLFLKTLKRQCIDHRFSACLRHLKFTPRDPQASGIMIGQFRGWTVPFGFHTRLIGQVGAKLND